MRFVADLAIIRRRWVGGFLAHPLLQILVARQAHIRGLRQKQFVQFCLMRTVALRALAVLNGLMSDLGCLDCFSHGGMTLETERALVLHKHPINAAGVRGMAILAYALRKRRMHNVAWHLFHELGVALYAEFFPDRLEQFPLIRSMGMMT